MARGDPPAFKLSYFPPSPLAKRDYTIYTIFSLKIRGGETKETVFWATVIGPLRALYPASQKYGATPVAFDYIDKKCGHPTIQGMKDIKNVVLANLK